LEVIPWSFDGAIKHVLGQEYSIDELWEEYQLFLNSWRSCSCWTLNPHCAQWLVWML